MSSEAMRWLDAEQAQMQLDLVELANQNSGSDNLTGLLSLANWIEAWMDLPLAAFQRIALPPRTFVDEAGEVVEEESPPALRWDFQPNAGKRVLLAIHYDTVYGPEHDFQTCSMLESDRLGGPGVADAKGGIVVLRNALRAVSRFSSIADLGWTVVLNPDEEIGSPSSAGLLQSIASEFDFGLLFEPSLPSGELVSIRKGSGNFALVVRGKSAHAGRHFDEGRNAIALLCDLMSSLHQLNGRREGATINLGAITGGGPLNVVPALAVGRFNVRLNNATDIEWFLRESQRLVTQANLEEGFQVDLHGSITSPPKEVGPEALSLMQAIESVIQQLENRSVRWTATGGVCDGNKLAAAGLPNIDTLGPVGGELHSSQEWVQLSSLSQKAKVIATLLDGFASDRFPQLVRTR